MVEVKPDLVGWGNTGLVQSAPSPIRQLDERFAQLPGLIRLTLGEPDLPVADHVKRAAQRAIDQDDSHYASSAGHLSLRQAISDYLQASFATPVYNPSTEVVVTIGAAEALFASFKALFNPGDQVIIPTPTYPIYRKLAQLLGLEVVFLTTAPDFKLTPAKLRFILAQHPAAKGLIINYPTNPTGVSYSETELVALAEQLQKTNLLVISDEIYAELSYDQGHKSIAHWLPNQTLVVSGLSKAFAMTGYRMGYIAGPEAFVQVVRKLHQFLVACPPGPMMAAAEEALRHGQVDIEKTRQCYQRRRDAMLAGLSRLGLQVPHPAGTFYLFVKIPLCWGSDDIGFVEDLATKAKVGVVPGSLFGPGGEGYIRLSYATSWQTLSTVLERLNRYLASLPQTN